VKLTNTTASNLTLKPTEHERFAWDDGLPGFGIRLRRGARGRIVRRYIVQYRTIRGSQRRLTLGDANTVRCVQAKEKAKEILAQVRLGEDPQAEKIAARRTVTLFAGAREYLDANANRWRPSTAGANRRQLLNHAKPLHSRPVEQITRAEVAGLLGRIAREKGPIIANRVRTVMSGFFAWCILYHELGANPAVGIPRNAEIGRDRVLSDDELAAIWNATDDGSDFSRIVRLLILTACRRNEVGQLKWSEIAGDLFVLPAVRSKNKRSHEVPLCALAIAQLPLRSGERDAVFGKSEAGFSGWGYAKAALERKLNGQIPKRWALHDLRRSAATWLSEHGTEPAHIDALLNHASGVAKSGIRSIYNRAEYRGPKKIALAKWAEHIASITGQDVTNIAALERSA
jgi:integrase